MICQYIPQEIRQFQVRTEDDGEHFEFEFPPQMFKNKYFLNGKDVEKELTRAGIKNYFQRGKVFLKTLTPQKDGLKIYFKCKFRQCPSRLVYKRRKIANDGKLAHLQILTFKNVHYHMKSKDPQKAKRQQITNFIFNLAGKDYVLFRERFPWMERFDVDSRDATTIIDQLYWIHNTEDQILTRLAYQGQIIRRFHDEGQTMVVYMRTNTMKESYLQFGEAVLVEMNYQTLKRPTPFGNNYALIHLYTQDQNLRLAMVGVAVLTLQKVINFKKIFQFFFDTTCENKIPLCFITDQIQTLTQALSELRAERGYSYAHLFSWTHAINSLKPIVKTVKGEQKIGYLILQKMCRAIQQFHESTYVKLLAQIKQLLKQRQDIYDIFIKKQQYISCRRMPQNFVGYAITTKFWEQVNGRTSTTQVYRVHTGRLFYKVIQMQKTLIKQSQRVSVLNTGIIKHYSAEINYFQDRLQAQIMQKLVTNYSLSKDLKKIKKDAQTYILTDKQNRMFQVKFLIIYEHWQCECNELVITGLPCCHLISVILDIENSGHLQYYINPRWIHNKQNMIIDRVGPMITNKKRRP